MNDTIKPSREDERREECLASFAMGLLSGSEIHAFHMGWAFGTNYVRKEERNLKFTPAHARIISEMFDIPDILAEVTSREAPDIRIVEAYQALIDFADEREENQK